MNIIISNTHEIGKKVIHLEVRNQTCLNIHGIYLKLSVTLSEEIKKKGISILVACYRSVFFNYTKNKVFS